MAPNRKSATSLDYHLNGLSDTVVFTKQYYLPLTDPKEEQTQILLPTPSIISTNYWDWSADDNNTNNHDLFSASHIQDNLITEASKRCHKDEAAATTAIVAKPQPDTEREDWVADNTNTHTERAMVIHRILAEERARLLVCGAAIQATELAAARSWTPSQQRAGSSENKSWESSDGIPALVEYEEARELLAAETIVQQLQHWKGPASSPTLESSNEYWTWS